MRRPDHKEEALLTGSLPATGPLPTAWCRTILTALEDQGAEDRAAGHLGMLLCSLIERQLGPDEFARQLARYAADPRPEIADAASVLQCAWERTTAVMAPAPLPLVERLGLLGRLLDEAGAHAAYLSLGPAGTMIQGCGPTPYQCTLGPQQLQHAYASRCARTGEELGTDPAVPGHFATRLRLVGVLLDTQGVQACELFVGPHCVEVECNDGSCQMFPFAETTEFEDERAQKAGQLARNGAGDPSANATRVLQLQGS